MFTASATCRKSENETRAYVSHGVVEHEINVLLERLQVTVQSSIDLLLDLLQTLLLARAQVISTAQLASKEASGTTNDRVCDEHVVIGVIALRREGVEELVAKRARVEVSFRV
jgi:hypothetical protein